MIKDLEMGVYLGLPGGPSVGHRGLIRWRQDGRDRKQFWPFCIAGFDDGGAASSQGM